jgi:heptosyltransferase-2
MRILVVRFSSIGDIVLTTPVFRLLKTHFPDAEIHWVTKTSFASVLEGNPYIDRTWKWDNDQDRKVLRGTSFDFVVDLQKNARSRQVKWMFFGTPHVTISKQNFKKILWVLFKQHRIRKWPWLSKTLTTRSFTDRCIDVLGVFGISNDHKGLDFSVDSTTEDEVVTKLNGLNRFACFSMGGSFFTKRLPLQKWQQLLVGLNSHVVLIGGKSDAEEAIKLQNMIHSDLLGHGFQVLNLVGELNLKESAVVIQFSNAVYTGDTGMLHISAALGKEVKLFWGNTIPEFGMEPPMKMGGKLMQFEVEGLNCRPCSKLGFDACPKGHFGCMNNLQI